MDNNKEQPESYSLIYFVYVRPRIAQVHTRDLRQFLLFALGYCILNLISNRRSDEQRRIGTDDNAEQQCKDEATDACTAEAEDGEQYHER